jgi:hypothetical protein
MTEDTYAMEDHEATLDAVWRDGFEEGVKAMREAAAKHIQNKRLGQVIWPEEIYHLPLPELPDA